jgi:uncharacterized protein (DUF2132 family)
MHCASLTDKQRVAMTDKAIDKANNELKKQQNNPLHGITLERILTVLREHYSWKDLNRKVELNCFFSHPSIKSSLTYLRKNDWARKKVENLYLELIESLKAAD